MTLNFNNKIITMFMSVFKMKIGLQKFNLKKQKNRKKLTYLRMKK